MSVQSSGKVETTAPVRESRRFQARDWAVANALGLALVYALGALSAGLAEAAGAEHESIVRDVAGLIGFVGGATVFMFLRHRALTGRVPWSTAAALITGIGLALGFVVGFLIAGPPLDFVLGIVALGTIGGGLQWRRFRYEIARPGGLLVAGITGWIVAAFAAIAVAIAFGDGIDALFGSGVAAFVAVTGTIGLVAGGVGGLIEGRALANRIGANPPVPS